MEKIKLFADKGSYANKSQWAKIIDYALLGIGVAFLLAGTIFFFAYNWANMHRFTKLGIIETLIILGTGSVFALRSKSTIQNILLTTVSILVGLLFSVFGQIYQTGADAYDFFLGWSIFITLWAIISKFPPLWIIFYTLVNITIILYSQQVAENWSVTFTCILLFIVGISTILVLNLCQQFFGTVVPDWVLKIFALTTAFFITVGLIVGLNRPGLEWFIGLSFCLITYCCAVFFAIKSRLLYLLCIVALSTIGICSALLLKTLSMEETSSFLFVSLFIIFSITLLTSKLITLQNDWSRNEE
ncbi:MAG: DUF2157 domain-containing protein [Pedobacter sp.]|nr:DUF2157 domain-containing protein [Pedobacter sp.]